MHRNISGVRFTVSFLALLLVVSLSACSSNTVAPTRVPKVSPAIPSASTYTSTPATAVPPFNPKALTGTFHERVAYDTPESTENVDFVFTVSSGVVKNLTLNSTPQESRSAKYQKQFMGAITGQVVGMKISQIGSFDRVGGASLTTPAFNQAVAQLKAQS